MQRIAAITIAIAATLAACDPEPVPGDGFDPLPDAGEPDHEPGAAPGPDLFVDALADVQINAAPGATEILALDGRGAVIGSVTLLVSPAGAAPGYYLRAHYDDGHALSVAFDETSGETIEQTLPSDVLYRRAQALELWVTTKNPEIKPYVCVTTILAGAAACAKITKIWACPAAIIASVCACRKVIKDLLDFDFSVCDELGK